MCVVWSDESSIRCVLHLPLSICNRSISLIHPCSIRTFRSRWAHKLRRLGSQPAVRNSIVDVEIAFWSEALRRTPTKRGGPNAERRERRKQESQGRQEASGKVCSCSMRMRFKPRMP